MNGYAPEDSKRHLQLPKDAEEGLSSGVIRVFLSTDPWREQQMTLFTSDAEIGRITIPFNDFGNLPSYNQSRFQHHRVSLL